MEREIKSGQRVRMIFVLCLLGWSVLAGGCSDLKREKGQEGREAVLREHSAQPEATDSAVMRCYLGEIQKDLTPFIPDSKADRRFLSLVYQQMGESDGYTIETLRDTPEQGHTVYRIRSSDRRECLGADELIWNLYLRCQTGYFGLDEINRMAIMGLEEYQFGASGKQLRNRKKTIKEKREMLCKKYRKEIQKKIIRPALEREYHWVESLYEDSSQNKLTKKYPKPAALFVRYFAPNTDYAVKKKGRERVLCDVVRQYQGDTKRLSRATGDHYEAAMRGLLIEKLWKEQAAGTGNIRGIRKIDSRTIEVETTLYQRKDRKRLESIYLLSRGSQEDVYREGKLSHHTGRYEVAEKTKDGWLLSADHIEKGSVAKIRVQTGKYCAADCVRNIQSNTWDLAVIKDRLPEEKDETKAALEKGNARWSVAALGAVLYNPQIINATAAQEDDTMDDDILPFVDSLRINEYEE